MIPFSTPKNNRKKNIYKETKDSAYSALKPASGAGVPGSPPVSLLIYRDTQKGSKIICRHKELPTTCSPDSCSISVHK